ncbi:MAG: IS1634 family transposase, partial [Candidatus Paceibacteria bacterium]
MAQKYGIVLVLRQIWEKLGFGNIFRRHLRKKKNKKNLAEAILALAINRLLAPSSELGIMKWKESVYEPDWDKLTLSDFYRALDFLVETKEESEVEIFAKTTNLFNQKLDLILFDTTSIRYWGEGKTELLKHGYSKEKRGDLKQLIVGILMTKEGIPVGHEVWPGNTSDLKSFMEILEKVKSKFQIEKVVWVCDRGMVSEDNLKEVQKVGHEYIVGIKMRQLSEAEQKKFLGTDDMIRVHSELYVKEVKVKGEGRYIICYNPLEAAYEKKQREFFKEILRKKVLER